MATEIAYVVLKPGVDLTSGTTGQAWDSTITTLKVQPGFQRAHCGRSIETPNLLMMFIDWDSLQSHKNFIADPAYGPFVKTLTPLFDSLHLHHFTPSPFPPSILGSAPVTEFATFYNTQPGFLDNVAKFMSNVGTPEGVLGAAYGETIEDDVKEHGKQEGGKAGKAVVLLIGWTSKDAHMRFRETETFKKNIGLLRDKMEGAEMFHVEVKAV